MSKNNKVIIAGSRSCSETHKDYMKKIDLFLSNMSSNEIEIVSGTAKGADRLGENYAKLNNLPVKKFPANWDLGKSAGYVRNEDMAIYGTHLIAIWDGESKGTKSMIKLAKKHNLKIKIIYI